jgi:hypothetical protein
VKQWQKKKKKKRKNYVSPCVNAIIVVTEEKIKE